MWDMSVAQVLEIVEEINNGLVEQQQDDAEFFFWLETSVGWGGVITVEFLGYPVWQSENDERVWVDDDNIEPLEGFLRRQVQSVLDVIGKLKVVEDETAG